jgi:hypothetical protein
MPVNAWHLFPVKEEAVTENKDNSVSYRVREGIACLIGLGVGILVGIFIFDSLNFRVIKHIVIDEMNEKLIPVSLTFFNDAVLMGMKSSDFNGSILYDLFDIDTAPIKAAVKQQYKE